ncbi:carbohydrate sulfotransferase 3-like [Penaeus indicus]|uniref:carbohydrate sulfotransferase 3-like n=1 Tax=Penaeus indicus TaxID=29960 RepID=UPI00300D04CD
MLPAPRPRVVQNILVLLFFLLFYVCLRIAVLGGQEEDPSLLRYDEAFVYRVEKKLPLDAYADARDETALPKQPPLWVLTLSSLPRSGSTLMAQFLGTLANSVVFFEPMWIKEYTPCADDEDCVVDYIYNIFNCSYKQDFEDWFRKKDLFFGYFHSDVKSCKGAGCRDALDVRGMCERSDARVMKIIRTRLAFLEPLMSDPEINFKVIFLTRDPRGSLNSIRKFGWNRDPLTRCSHLDKDQVAYDELSELYPDKVMLVKHEDFCLDPMGKAEELMEFLYGHSTVPEELKTYLANHMTSKTQKGTMSTVKNSSQEYDAWRYKIREDDLLKIESEPICARTIESMGHVLFGSIQRANDSSVPLFVQ